MQPSEIVRSNLPYLRRYARALAGSQTVGDAAVKATLHDLLTGTRTLNPQLPEKVALYRVFHECWPDVHKGEGSAQANEIALDIPGSIKDHLERIATIERQAFLLHALEEFAHGDIADILEMPEAEVERHIASETREVANIPSERVLIIEDEMLIALDLADMVEKLGHDVVEVVTNHQQAVRAAKEHRPGLILADIKLAKGSSGIAAVREILDAFSVPVIFVTAYPERLLTGERIEPAFLVTKPFQPEGIRAAISQALSCKAAPAVI